MSNRTRTLKKMRLAGIMVALTVFAAGVVACGGSEGGELEVTNIDPRAGATAGQQPVKILGNNFRQDIGYTVYFGTKRSERATILDEHTLIVTTPQMDEDDLPESRRVDVVVAADNGPAYRIRQGFAFEDMSGNVMERVGTSGEGPGGQGRF